MRYLLPIIKKSKITNIREDREGGKKKNPSALLVGMQISAAIVENNIEVPQKIKNIAYDPAISLPGTYPKETKSLCQRYICNPMFIVAFFTVAKNIETI